MLEGNELFKSLKLKEVADQTKSTKNPDPTGNLHF